METTCDLKAITPETWICVFKRLQIQGFGEFYTKDKYLLAKTPFLNEPEILAGILEGILNVQLDLKNSVPPLIFEVKRPIDTSLGK